MLSLFPLKPDATDYDNTWLGSIRVVALRVGSHSSSHLLMESSSMQTCKTIEKIAILQQRKAIHSQGSIQLHPEISSCSGGVN